MAPYGEGADVHRYYPNGKDSERAIIEVRHHSQRGVRKEDVMKYIAIATVVCLLFLCGCSEQTAKVPEQAISQIYALTSIGTSVSRFARIQEFEDKGSYCYISIDIIPDPEFVTNLEDAFGQAEIYTDAVARDIVDILKKHNVEKDVSVWSQLPLGEGKVALLGKTWYNAGTKTYRFERYKR